jgi:putative membrane protein
LLTSNSGNSLFSTGLKQRTVLFFAMLFILTLLVWTALHAYEFNTWVMEVAPIFIALPVLCITYQRFPLSSLVYFCIFMHMLVLITGGTYTYARVPLGFQLAEWFELSRNPYDKIGHFFQGFVPALVTREILLRGNYINGRTMLNFLVVCVVLAISACYEFIEWAAALLLGQGADEFLGTQGYAWDTQSDMLFALIGALTALTLLSSYHDRQISKLH